MNEPKKEQPLEKERPLTWDEYLAGGLLMVMALIAFINVLGRYLFHYSLAFTEELTINLFVWMTVLGSGLAFSRGAQLGMTGVFRLFPVRLKQGVIVLGAVLSAGLFVAIDTLLLRSIWFEISVFHARSPALGIPVWIYYAGVLPCSVAVFLGAWRGAKTALTELSAKQTAKGDA